MEVGSLVSLSFRIVHTVWASAGDFSKSQPPLTILYLPETPHNTSLQILLVFTYLILPHHLLTPILTPVT